MLQKTVSFFDRHNVFKFLLFWDCEKSGLCCKRLTLSQTIPGFYVSAEQYFSTIVMVLCPSSVHRCVQAPVSSSFKKVFLAKLLTGFLRNFTGMFLRWSSFKFLQIIVFYEEFWLPCQSK